MNLVILKGNVGADPEIRQTANGVKVASIRMVTSKKKKDANGQRVEESEWHSLVAWDKQAEMIEKYVKKGTAILIQGELKTRSWQDKNTQENRYKTEVTVRTWEFAEKSQPEGNPQQQGGRSGSQKPENMWDQVQQTVGQSQPQQDTPFSKPDDFATNIPQHQIDQSRSPIQEDDIPF